MKYRFTTIVEGEVKREITEEEKGKLREIQEKSMAPGLHIVEFKIEKLDGKIIEQNKPQSIKEEPTNSISDLVSQLNKK